MSGHPHDVQVMAHQLATTSLMGGHDPAQQHQALAQLEAAPLDLQPARSIVEQPVLQLLHAVIQALDRLELAIDDVVQQPVQQVADPEPGQVGVLVPALDGRADVQAVVLADGDQRLAGDEGRELTCGQLAGAGSSRAP